MASSSNNAVVQMQKIASDTQIKLQQMTDASSAKTFAYNTAEAEKSRNWQTEMSNTSHQREVKDLIKAGLNPVLSSGGSGAQGYTTSSASGQADNAASAVASLQASRMSGLANIESSTISAKAQRAAAAASARAMKEAAATQAAAARYAAAMNYQSSVYKADRDYNAKVLQYKTQRDIAFNAPTGNPIKILDRQFTNMGMYDGISKGVKEAAKNIVKIAQTDPNKLLNTNNLPSSGKITAKNFKINMLGSLGKGEVSKIINGLGLTNNEKTRTIVFKAFALNDVASQVVIKSLYNNARLSRYAKLRSINRI